MKNILIAVGLLFFSLACSKPEKHLNQSPVNLQHTLSLVDSLDIEGETICYIYIYADAPNYKPVGAVNEGITCVDDVGRFLEVIETEIINYNRQELRPIARGLSYFLLHLSRSDGLWYNFMLEDGSINRSHRNSVADFGWWAARGLRGLAAAYRIFQEAPEDSILLKQIHQRIQACQGPLEACLIKYPAMLTDSLPVRPAWLIKDAADISAEMLMALCKLQRTGAFHFEQEIRYLAEGLLDSQITDTLNTLHGIYYCWRNLWHNWGNNMAFALLEAFQLFGDSRYLDSVQLWADNFVPYLIQHDFPWELIVKPEGSIITIPMPQIAYGFNSLYRGLKQLADITGLKEHTARAEQVFGWFKGKNPARIRMYDPASGHCFDGINEGPEINRNSGAESTLECLLAIQYRGTF
jgi:hypothetical protein